MHDIVFILISNLKNLRWWLLCTHSLTVYLLLIQISISQGMTLSFKNILTSPYSLTAGNCIICCALLWVQVLDTYFFCKKGHSQLLGAIYPCVTFSPCNWSLNMWTKSTLIEGCIFCGWFFKMPAVTWSLLNWLIPVQPVSTQWYLLAYEIQWESFKWCSVISKSPFRQSLFKESAF